MAANSTPKITNYCTYLESPFTVELLLKEYTPRVEEFIVEDLATGKLYKQSEIPKNKVITTDSTPYTKIFRGQYEARKTLSEASRTMLDYILEFLKPNKDEIIINKRLFLEFGGYAATNSYVYYKAIEGLLKNKIIARQAGSNQAFYINPNILFNGDRTKLSKIKLVKPVVPNIPVQ